MESLLTYHPEEWEEVVDRFGWNRRRRQLLDGLAEALALLADGMGRAIDAAHAALVGAVTVAQATGV
jgi:hypothetical protein